MGRLENLSAQQLPKLHHLHPHHQNHQPQKARLHHPIDAVASLWHTLLDTSPTSGKPGSDFSILPTISGNVEVRVIVGSGTIGIVILVGSFVLSSHECGLIMQFGIDNNLTLNKRKHPDSGGPVYLS
jgi:hypothetical protein